MKAIFYVLELAENESISEKNIAMLCNADIDDVKIKKLDKCSSGYEKKISQIADLYLWTCKYWYGLYADKLTFIELRNQSEPGILFSMKYSQNIKIAISVEKLSFIDKEGLDLLNKASSHSIEFFNKKRIKAIRPYISKLQKYFKIYNLYKNPFL
jgi:hypothetical protein